MSLPTTSSAARTALLYITAGALLVIWTGVWYIYAVENQNSQPGHGVYYWMAGLAATGLTLIGIGLGLGRIGSSARQAEVPVHNIIQAPAAPAATAGPVAVVPTTQAAPAAVGSVHSAGGDAAVAPSSSVAPPVSMS